MPDCWSRRGLKKNAGERKRDEGTYINPHTHICVAVYRRTYVHFKCIVVSLTHSVFYLYDHYMSAC